MDSHVGAGCTIKSRIMKLNNLGLNLSYNFIHKFLITAFNTLKFGLQMIKIPI